MAKITKTFTIDKEVALECRARGINMSQQVNRSLYNAVAEFDEFTRFKGKRGRF